jgi:GMP synthase (glutamine-hydrolysing)
MGQVNFLIIEGNTASGRVEYVEASGAEPNQHYAKVLEGLCPHAQCEVVFPADGDVRPSRALKDYDGVVITGSALHIDKGEPESLRQVDLAREVFRADVPFFGSCWGLQVATVAAGGRVGANPKGRELGIARNIVKTATGAGHPLLEGRDGVYSAIAIHLDHVIEQPEGMTVLSSNAVSEVQAAEIRFEGGTFWGVQYHPEFSFAEMAAIFTRVTTEMLEEGFFTTREAMEAYIADWYLLHHHSDRTDLAWRYGIGQDVLDDSSRQRDIANWITHQVLKRKKTS